MSEQTWKDVAFVAGLLALGALLWWLLRDDGTRQQPYLAARWDDDRRDWVNEEAHDVGPDALQLLEDLDRHLNVYVAYSPDLNAAYGPTAPTTEGD